MTHKKLSYLAGTVVQRTVPLKLSSSRIVTQISYPPSPDVRHVRRKPRCFGKEINFNELSVGGDGKVAWPQPRQWYGALSTLFAVPRWRQRWMRI